MNSKQRFAAVVILSSSMSAGGCSSGSTPMTGSEGGSSAVAEGGTGASPSLATGGSATAGGGMMAGVGGEAMLGTGGAMMMSTGGAKMRNTGGSMMMAMGGMMRNTGGSMMMAMGGMRAATGGAGTASCHAAGTLMVTNQATSAYVIDGAANPTLTLCRGSTYTFAINTPGHPFYIKTMQSTGTANAFDTGVTGNGTAMGNVTFAVPMSAPNTLYYDCSIHAAMTGVLNIVN